MNSCISLVAISFASLKKTRSILSKSWAHRCATWYEGHMHLVPKSFLCWHDKMILNLSAVELLFVSAKRWFKPEQSSGTSCAERVIGYSVSAGKVIWYSWIFFNKNLRWGDVFTISALNVLMYETNCYLILLNAKQLYSRYKFLYIFCNRAC